MTFRKVFEFFKIFFPFFVYINLKLEVYQIGNMLFLNTFYALFLYFYYKAYIRGFKNSFFRQKYGDNLFYDQCSILGVLLVIVFSQIQDVFVISSLHCLLFINLTYTIFVTRKW